MTDTSAPASRRDIVFAASALPLAAAGCASLEPPHMADNITVIRRFFDAWSRLNPAELAGYFAENGVYHNMPTGPVSGRAAIETFIASFIKPWTATTWDVLNIAAAGDVVLVERLDRTRVGERSVNLPCCGVFEMKDGKIKVWRDYFDLQTYMKGLAG